MTEWQDISTAPKGVPILVYRPRVEGPCVAVVTDINLGCLKAVEPESGKMWKAEYWMPLPTPPVQP